MIRAITHIAVAARRVASNLRKDIKHQLKVILQDSGIMRFCGLRACICFPPEQSSYRFPANALFSPQASDISSKYVCVCG
jgi:hypothetical protein